MAPSEQVLRVAQMRAAEQALIAAGSSVDRLMHIAGTGAAAWVWRLCAGRPVTVLCGPGNNGGDGYVIAEAIRARGGAVRVVAPMEPATDAARRAREAFRGEVTGRDAGADSVSDSGAGGEVLVDCLFGSGLTRPLSEADHDLLVRLARLHAHLVAIDVPSGVEADSGRLLNEALPHNALTLALGAWKPAHFLMPASARMGTLRRVGIGIDAVPGAASLVARPRIDPPAADAHKYRRGLLAVVGGAMPGAAILAARAAQGAGAGYVRLFAPARDGASADLVVDTGPLAQVLTDDRNAAVLVGPGLGRDAEARERLAVALADAVPAVLDADALMLLSPRVLAGRTAAAVATPHEGELAALREAFELADTGTRADQALALARAGGMVVVAKGPNTLVAAPDGRLAYAPRASSWLSTAGTGDVLAGIIAARLATGREAFAAACEGVWLHGEAARLCGAAFTAGDLAGAVPRALSQCL